MTLTAQIRLVTRHQIDHGKMTVKLLAHKTGYSQAHVSNFVTGKRDLSAQALECVLVAIGFSVEIYPTPRFQNGKGKPAPPLRGGREGSQTAIGTGPVGGQTRLR
jgi:hypothetical protein